MANMEFTSHANQFLKAMEARIPVALEALGEAGVTFAKMHITEQGAIDTGNLRNSINKQVVARDKCVHIGTPVHYAIYVEMGTGAANVSGGTNKPSWVYMDAHGEFHRAFPQKPRPFIKPSVAEHEDSYKAIINRYMKGI